MAGSAAVALVGLILATTALVMVIIIYARPEVVGVSEPEGTRAEGTRAEPKWDQADSMSYGTSGGKSAKSGGSVKRPKYTYTFAYEDYTKPYNYMDSEGKLKGIMLDMVQEACDRAGQKCVHMYMGKSGTPCWDSDVLRGMGLDRKYYDACATWSKTQERTNVYQFTDEIMEPTYTSLYTADDSVTTAMLTTKNVGFIDGHFSSPSCLAKEMAVTLDEDKVVLAKGVNDLRAKLMAGQVSFAFLPSGQSGLKEVGEKMKCGGGFGVMARYDSHMPMWFNKAFREMKRDGTYKDMCDKAQDNHGAAAACV